ncbi:ABC transporter permease [Cysteiniphilum sp. JM-1]|uniref:ABC transporter permease n=2 Tax=Fastidiosibacteraceae TaxID=2056687 RepID=UPI00168D2E99
MNILTKQSFQIIRTLTVNHLKIKYKRTSLGFFWSLLNPLFTVGVISLVFSAIMKMDFSHFVALFFPAFLAWTFFANSINASTLSIVSNESLLRKTPINVMIFPLVSVSISFVEFVLTSVVFLIILVIVGYIPSLSLICLFVSVICLLLATIGVSLLASVVSTFMRDVAYLIGVFIQLWFYLTPVLYPKEFLIGKYKILELILTFNPMVYIIEMFRDPITYHKFISTDTLLISGIFSVVVFLLGVWVFNKNKHKLVYRL